MHVVYDRENYRLLGITKLFSDFGIVGGEVLTFEFVDGSNFNVHIFGEDGNEMHYNSNDHETEDSSPQTGKIVRIIANLFLSVISLIVDILNNYFQFQHTMEGGSSLSLLVMRIQRLMKL